MAIPFFIDFDRVLFDTDPLREKLCSVLVHAGFSGQAAHDSYRAAAAGHVYHPSKHILAARDIEPTVPVQEDHLLKELYGTLSDLLYPDARHFLEQIDRGAYQLDLLTLGDVEFQQAKIDLTGVAQFFDHTYICTVEKAEFLPTLVSPADTFILIDDRLDTVQAVETAFPQAFCIYKDYRKEHPEYEGVRSARVTSLAEVFSLALPAHFPPLRNSRAN